MQVQKFKAVTHIGTMEVEQKNRGSYEGAGLSVSVHPGAWAHIAEIGTEGFVLKKPGTEIKLLDAKSLKRKDEKIVIDWAVDQNLLVEGSVFEVSYYDEEIEARCSFEVKDRVKAEEEAEDLTRPKIKGPIVKYLATEKLAELSFAHGAEGLTSGCAFDLALITYAEQMLGVDGVWWEESLDAYELSAPRGVIFNSRLGEFEKNKADFADFDLDDEFDIDEDAEIESELSQGPTP